MTREEWEKGIQQWQQSGGLEGKKADPASDPPADDSGGGWLGTAGSFIKGAGRQLATQGGFAKDFAEGSDPNHPTAAWLGREAVDFAPSIAIDAFAPELALAPAVTRLGKLGGMAAEALYSGAKGALGGAAANPDDRKGGAQTGATVAGGGSVIGSVVNSSPVRRTLLPLAIAAEIAQHGGMIPHGTLGGIYPWTVAHGLSALAGLAKAAGLHAPAKAGAIGSKVEQGMGNGE